MPLKFKSFFMSGFLLLTLLLSNLSVLAIERNQFLDFLIDREVSSPQAMPPHPRILEQARQGALTLPDFMFDPQLAVLRGIDQPNPLAVNAPTGSWRALAILVEFSDKTNNVAASFFDSLLFGTSYKQLNHYFKSVSYNQLDIVTLNLPSTTDWQTMPRTYSYYVNNNYCTDGIYPRNCRKLAEDATAAVNSLVDFSNYDNDGDGYVDTVFLIHAGQGAEYTGKKTDVWSHSWWTMTEPEFDGVKIGSYTIEPEYWALYNDMTIGVYAHELAHALGAYDLYDYDNSSQGVGDWSLMGSGSWNGILGDTPAFLDAWHRLSLGWLAPTIVNGSITNATIRNAENYQEVFFLKSSLLGAEEYFLVENRQQLSYDSALPGSGLLIWHIDEALIDNDRPNNLECEQLNNWLCGMNHFLVALHQADGSLNLENNTNYGDSGDAYPGALNNRAFNSTSNPNTSSYYYSASANTNLTVTNISNSASIMTADLFAEGPTANFNKSTPFNQSTDVAINTSLSWITGLGTFSYEYCIDEIDDDMCTSPALWVPVGTHSISPQIILNYARTYFWQVRSIAPFLSNADDGAWWSFSTINAQLENRIFIPVIITKGEINR